MKRFLSVDWDFFVDANSTQRILMFPDGGNENLPDSLRNYIWDSRYANPELEKIKVTSDYKYLLNICKTFRGEAIVADSHKWMYDFVIKNTEYNEEFEVYNIDFHHDLYNFQTRFEEVNCGNWATLLRRDRPKMKYKWVKCDTSDVIAGGKKVDAEMMTMTVFRLLFHGGIAEEFDYLFMCRSAMWSPPHLDPKFVRAVKAIKCYASLELGINKPRPYEIPHEFAGFKAYFDSLEDISKKDAE